jgi:hypothetical protein
MESWFVTSAEPAAVSAVPELFRDLSRLLLGGLRGGDW